LFPPNSATLLDRERSGRTEVVHVLAPGRQGGAEQVVAMLAVQQRAIGARVLLVLAPEDARDHPYVERLQKLQVPVTVLQVGRRSYLREYRKLKGLLRGFAPRVVHTHGYHADIVAGAAASALRIPQVSTVHGFLGVPLRNKIYERLQLLALRRADAVIAVSRPLVAKIASSGVQTAKIHFVANAFAPVTMLRSRISARDELGLTRDALVAGWIGRLSSEKGADVMLRAIAMCRSPWRLSIIGDGPQKATLRKLAVKLGIVDRVVWHGAVESAGALITAFDAFVLSSRTEGTPIVLFEAMHAKVPVIATRVGGVPDVVTPAEAVLVASEDPASIANALDDQANSREHASRRSAAAAEKIVAAFDPHDWATSIGHVYEGALSQNGSKRL
jgi:glycosyltransferase involved in cell wall biosynthesis